MAELQSAVQALLDELVESGEEVGLQAAVYVDGKLVVDCVAGWRSQARDALVADDTLFTIYSATKGVVGSAVHMLAEREL
ncbi:MAG: serine hydrolase, partial [Gemmatimonadetes bacterium]|nr:serine hydrolase [Gemmatimonadota bacterium]